MAGGATIGAYTEVEDFVFIGQGVMTISGKVNKIGTNAFIGARSLVTHPVNAFTTIYGSPARQI